MSLGLINIALALDSNAWNLATTSATTSAKRHQPESAEWSRKTNQLFGAGHKECSKSPSVVEKSRLWLVTNISDCIFVYAMYKQVRCVCVWVCLSMCVSSSEVVSAWVEQVQSRVLIGCPSSGACHEVMIGPVQEEVELYFRCTKDLSLEPRTSHTS